MADEDKVEAVRGEVDYAFIKYQANTKAET